MKDPERIISLVESVFEMGDTNYSQTAATITRNGKPMLRQSLFKMVKNGSIRLSVFLDILDALDLKMVIERK